MKTNPSKPYRPGRGFTPEDVTSALKQYGRGRVGSGSGFWRGRQEFTGVGVGYDWRAGWNRPEVGRINGPAWLPKMPKRKGKQEEEPEPWGDRPTQTAPDQRLIPRPTVPRAQLALGPGRPMGGELPRGSQFQHIALGPGTRTESGERAPREWNVGTSGEVSPGRGTYSDVIGSMGGGTTINMTPAGQTYLGFGAEYGTPKPPRRR